MLRKTFISFGALATLGAAFVSTAASAAPANGSAIRDAATIKSDVTTVGYYSDDDYYPRYHRHYYRYYYHYYPRSYGGYGY